MNGGRRFAAGLVEVFRFPRAVKLFRAKAMPARNMRNNSARRGEMRRDAESSVVSAAEQIHRFADNVGGRIGQPKLFVFGLPMSGIGKPVCAPLS